MSDDLDDNEALAAEYALGTLDGDDRRRAEARQRSDPAFAALIDAWTERLAPLAGMVAPVEPPDTVWRRIEAALDAGPAGDSAAIRRRLGLWRGAAIAAGALAATLALYIWAGPATLGPQPAGQYVAVLNRGAAEPAWVVTVDLAANRLTIRPVGDVAVAHKTLELWLVAGPGRNPRSLGALDPTGATSVPLARVAPAATPVSAAFAISLEPPGGSPTGQPTGPILYQGTLLPLSD